jgi:hypothetical protein
MRLYRNGEVEAGATCASCGERRRHVLGNAIVASEPCVLCGNCRTVLEKVRPRPADLATLQRHALRERRVADDPANQRARRAGDRRAAVPTLDLSID